MVGILLASESDARSYAQNCGEGMSSASGPWPGAPYAVPALIALALG